MMYRKLLSMVLVLATVLGLMPGTVFAQTDDQNQEPADVIPVEETGDSTAATEAETNAPTQEPKNIHTHCVCGGAAVNVHQHLCQDVSWRPLSEVVTLTSVNWASQPGQ